MLKGDFQKAFWRKDSNKILFGYKMCYISVTLWNSFVNIVDRAALLQAIYQFIFGSVSIDNNVLYASK